MGDVSDELATIDEEMELPRAETDELRGEIERLRALINQWADAEDEADMIRGIDLYVAYEALRKAVGR
jgi:hypothetical protein